MALLLGLTVLLFFLQKKELVKNPSAYFWIVTNLVLLSFVLPSLVWSFQQILHQFQWIPSYDLKSFAWVIQLVLFFIFMDFVKYLIHYSMHRYNWLWKIHLVHHSSTELNSFAAFKHSWLEAFINIGISCVIEFFFRVEPSVLFVVNVLFTYACVWQHTQLPFLSGEIPILRWWLITPGNHSVHHELLDHAHHRNLGFILTIWDRIFSTHAFRQTDKLIFGIHQPDYPYHSNLRQFFYPLIRSSPTQSKPPSPF